MTEGGYGNEGGEGTARDRRGGVGGRVHDAGLGGDRGDRSTRRDPVACGAGSTASDANEDGVARGPNSFAGYRGTATGYSAAATGNYAVANGVGTDAAAFDGIAMGSVSKVSASGGLAVGAGALVSGTYGVAVGETSVASGPQASAMGYQSSARGLGASALGTLSSAAGNDSVATGDFSTAAGSVSPASGNYAIAPRDPSTARGIGDVTTGAGTTTKVASGAQANNNIAVGRAAENVGAVRGPVAAAEAAAGRRPNVVTVGISVYVDGSRRSDTEVSGAASFSWERPKAAPPDGPRIMARDFRRARDSPAVPGSGWRHAWPWRPARPRSRRAAIARSPAGAAGLDMVCVGLRGGPESHGEVMASRKPGQDIARMFVAREAGGHRGRHTGCERYGQETVPGVGGQTIAHPVREIIEE